MGVMPDAPEPPPFTLSEEDVLQLAEELQAYHREFAGLFWRREQREWALKYLEGLLRPASDNKSAERLALRLEGGKVRNLQQFLGEGAWDDDAILARHAELVAESLGDAEGVLIVDGSDFAKKGRYSAGVARQYCGATGKVDNCQAGVFVAYASRHGYTLLDRRLYLPQEWFAPESGDRWERCQIPEGTAFRTKPELAWAMIEKLHDPGALPFRWVTCDEAFGDNHDFLRHLEALPRLYLADVSVSTLVWLERPRTEVPPAKSPGRPPAKERLAEGTPPPIRVDTLAAQLPKRAWRTYRVKAGEKGPIRAHFAFVRAVAARHGLPGPDVWVVFRRNRSEPQERKVFLSNAPADTPPGELVRVSGLRWPIETCFEEAKGSLGMADYQTRFWRGWHHHMTLVILAHHFVVRLRLRHKRGLRRSPSRKPANCSAPPCPAANSRRPKRSNSSATSNAPTTRPDAPITAMLTARGMDPNEISL
jgi:SRSO17 transposase